jgi:hypothetical protein
MVLATVEHRSPFPRADRAYGLRYLQFRLDSNPLVDWSEVRGGLGEEMRRLGDDQ